jgi:hypothetical protein
MPAAKKHPRPAPPTGPEGGLEPPTDLIYQSLETEMGGVEIYTTALQCVVTDELREEWEKYLEQTRTHVQVMRTLCEGLGLDPDRETPGRQVVRHIGKSLVMAMQMARGAGDPKAAEIVAAECVTLAETKDHANWALIAKLAEGTSGKNKQAMQDAADQVEDEEDEHLYHSTGWARELWLDALELPAQLPPPEEEEDVHSEEEAVEARKKSMEARG